MSYELYVYVAAAAVFIIIIIHTFVRASVQFN